MRKRRSDRGEMKPRQDVVAVNGREKSNQLRETTSQGRRKDDDYKPQRVKPMSSSILPSKRNISWNRKKKRSQTQRETSYLWTMSCFN